jgi:hypothetical protein
VGPKSSTVEQTLAELASRGHGVVTREQVLAAGVTVAELQQRVRTGTLHRVHWGVYRVGHTAPSHEARYIAAVRACGRYALLSGPAAGYLHRLVKGPPPPPEVTTRTERRVRGLLTRRSPGLNRDDAALVRGIPVTTISRTLVDLARNLPYEDLARACHQAGALHGTTPEHVESVLARRPNARGAKRLRAILHGDAPILLSKLERRFYRELRAAVLLLPEWNQYVDGRVVDCRWPSRKLTVELDSYRCHRSRYAWERDRRREREARARGDDFRRFTYGDVFERPGEMLAELRPILMIERAGFRSQRRRNRA